MNQNCCPREKNIRNYQSQQSISIHFFKKPQSDWQKADVRNFMSEDIYYIHLMIAFIRDIYANPISQHDNC